MHRENTQWEYLAWDLKNHLIEKSKINIDSNNFAAALIELDKAVDVFPKNALFFVKNGKNKESNEDINGALDDYDKVIKLSLIYIYRGYVKSRIGDIKGAVQDYEKAEKLKTKYHYVYFLRGRLNEKINNLNSALKDYDDAIKFNKKKNKKLFAKRAGIKKDLGDHLDAIEDFNKAINFNPTDPFLYVQRGFSKLQIRNIKSAISDYDKAIKINSEFFLAYYARGIAKISEANNSRDIKTKKLCYENSNDDFKKALKIAPGIANKVEEFIKKNEEAMKVLNENFLF